MKQEKKKVEGVILTFFTLFLSLSFMSTNSTEQFRPEMHGDGMVGPAKLPANVGLGHSARFPSAIQMFEPFPDESGFCLIAEDQLTFGHRCVPLEVPCLADLEVAAELR